MQKSKRAARELALNLLYQVDATDIHLDEAIETAREHVATEPDVFDCAEAMARGAHKNRKEIDKIIRRLSQDWPLARQPIVDRNILRLAIFELSGEDPTPAPVVVNEAVEIAKKYSTADSSKFVNGILGTYLREQEAGIKEPESEESAEEAQDVS